MNSKLKLSSIIVIVLFAGFISACKNNPTAVTVSTPPPIIGKQVTGDTLRGTLSGTVPNIQNGKAHPIYYMDASVIIPQGDTLLIQPGITIYMLNTGSTNAKGSPDFQVFGSLICAGQKGAPIYLTVPAALRKYSALTDNTSNSLWGGIEGAGPTNSLNQTPSGDIILKWTHIEFAGATSVVGDPIVKSGGTRYALWFNSPTANFIMEDSWITGSTDDPLRVTTGRISIFRNVVECASPNTGDFNMKVGTVGDIAYNLFIGIATNGPKLANPNGGPIPCNVNIYNNTIVTGGWRVNKPSRAGSINIEDGARGTVFNNLIVNCRTGFRLYDQPTLPDTANTQYGYQWYYGSVDTIVHLFYPNVNNVGGIEKPKPGDVAGLAKANDPKFVSYNVDQFPASVFAIFPASFGGQNDQTPYPALNLMRSMDENGNQRFVDVPTNAFKSDFHLAPGSPAANHAYTGIVKTNSGTSLSVPMTVDQKPGSSPLVPVATDVNHVFGTYGVKGLGADYGAYQTDGSGNQQ
jgi:hypothetical protein